MKLSTECQDKHQTTLHAGGTTTIYLVTVELQMLQNMQRKCKLSYTYNIGSTCITWLKARLRNVICMGGVGILVILNSFFVIGIMGKLDRLQNEYPLS